eukprot:TRINITY_DN6754_c3_g1_i4.p2 TRINITY_DN6754_c3_g1~~TRINITY_DN6754_c3_g1_i4.p2  ORF type:complete len:189 (+),score=-19.79 TRINITY_DN6754_c3_g1_i4:498-1064(+)
MHKLSFLPCQPITVQYNYTKQKYIYHPKYILYILSNVKNTYCSRTCAFCRTQIQTPITIKKKTYIIFVTQIKRYRQMYTIVGHQHKKIGEKKIQAIYILEQGRQLRDVQNMFESINQFSQQNQSLSQIHFQQPIVFFIRFTQAFQNMNQKFNQFQPLTKPKIILTEAIIKLTQYSNLFLIQILLLKKI